MSTNLFKELVRKLKDKEYRDFFVAEQIYSRLPLKMGMLREQRELTQKQFGEKARMAQAWVSKIENPNYGKLTISTLLRVASAHDVALVVDFVPFSKLLKDTINLSQESFEVSSFDEDSFNEGTDGETPETLSASPSSTIAYATSAESTLSAEENQEVGAIKAVAISTPSILQQEELNSPIRENTKNAGPTPADHVADKTDISQTLISGAAEEYSLAA